MTTLEAWLFNRGVDFDRIVDAACDVIDRFNREHGNYGFITVTRRVIEDGFDPWPTISVTQVRYDMERQIYHLFGYSNLFTHLVPEGTPAVCYDLNVVYGRRIL